MFPDQWLSMRSAALAIVVTVLAACACRGEETLVDAWRLAVARNSGLEASRLRTGAIWEDAQAAASERSPTASLRTGYLLRSSQPSFRGSQPGLSPTPISIPFAEQNAAKVSALAVAPIWTAGRLESSVAAANFRHSASAKSTRWAEMDLCMAVAEAYVAVLQAKASLSAAEQLLQCAESKATDVAQRGRQSRATDSEVLGSRLALAEALHETRKAENAVVTACAGYNQLLGRPTDFPVEAVEPVIPLLGESLEQLTQLAIDSRPDVQELQESARAHENDAAGWRASALPQLSAEAGFDYEENRFQSPQGIGTAGVYVDWNAFDAGKNRRKSSAASTRACAARAELKDLQSQIALEVLQAWRQRDDALGAERVAAQSLEYAEERDRSITQHRSQGVATESAALESGSAVVEARARYLYARTNRVLSQVRLRFVAGLLGGQ